MQENKFRKEFYEKLKTVSCGVCPARLRIPKGDNPDSGKCLMRQGYRKFASGSCGLREKRRKELNYPDED